MQKEAKTRIKINNLLQDAGWRFFDNEKGKANIALEQNAKITQKDIDAFGANYEKTKNGFIDFLLLDKKDFPLVVLEAKSEDKNPLDGKEQARRYAKLQNVRFIILSNGNLFVSIYKPENKYIYPIKNFLKAYITDSEIRDIIEKKDYAKLATNPKLTMADLRELNSYREKVPEYVKDYVPINKFM